MINNDDNNNDFKQLQPEADGSDSMPSGGIVFSGSFDAAQANFKTDRDAMPILPTRNLVLFPGVIAPISLARPSSRATAKAAEEGHITIAIVCQKDPKDDVPSSISELYPYGVEAQVIKVVTLPDLSQTAIIHATDKIRLLEDAEPTIIPEAPAAKVAVVGEIPPKDDDLEFKCLGEELRKSAKELFDQIRGKNNDLSMNIDNLPGTIEVINFVATNLPISQEEKYALLKVRHLKERGFEIMGHIGQQQALQSLVEDVKRRTMEQISFAQRQSFLQQQLEAIKKELYMEDDEVAKIVARAKELPMTDEARAAFDREAGKLDVMNANNPEYSVAISYLQMLADLPWGVLSPAPDDIKRARVILDNDHFGLERVKERVIEQIALLINNPEGRSPIICLVGPPGVGKTSLGQSVARALGREYRRVSLGGLHDESEIRGHRRTYIGAMPGRIMDAIRRAKSSNPVLLLDEIDKIGSDFKGDPAAAMLEVLDPEQNCHFHDNYIDVDFDLSKVLFIATANTLSTISQPLLDRMEIIDLSGYILEEKVEIARRHFIPALREEHKLAHKELNITPEAITKVIEEYTSESGVRQLEKKLAAIVRKVVLAKVSNNKWPHIIKAKHIPALLGTPIFRSDRYEGNDYPGVVTGLAWTAAGGEILYIEANAIKAKNDALSLTGNLGDVMKESASLALRYVRANAPTFGIDPAAMEGLSVHLHVPEGAIPKDGPSAGITMATAIVSALTGRRVKPRIAMTGEITLRGRVLPVGGIKEKILAAKRAGIDTIILSEENRRNIEEIPSTYLDGLAFTYVKDATEVIAASLEPALEPAAPTADYTQK